MLDKYSNFQQLAAAERRGIDYRIRAVCRDSPVAIIAPHGERGTSDLARAIAVEDYNLYCFEGLQRRPLRDLHITSAHFDEPRALKIVRRCDLVVALHGLRGTDARIDIGGRHRALRQQICTHLRDAGFDAQVVTTGPHAGIQPNNICNRGRQRAGVQVEITKALRGTLMLAHSRAQLSSFVAAVRAAIAADLALIQDSGQGPTPTRDLSPA
jgi:phage replication-related protein YjqB (UPF0714/DUF867 family)